jgi:type I restriction enzyme S subunit
VSDLKFPSGWAETTLGSALISVIGGGTPSRKVPAYFGGQIPWFTVKDMKGIRPNDAEEHITEAAIADSATNLIPANTLIVATRIALGRAIRPTVACAINQDLKALVLGSGINTDFLLYWIGANQRVIQDLGSGTTVSGIRLEALHGLPLLLPPAAEQARIVAKLEELLSDLDAGVAELKAAQKKLGQYRQSLLKAAVEGALTADWRAQHPPTETGAQLLQRILTERRARWETKQLARFKEQGKTPPKDWQKKYPEPVQPDTTDLPELPEGWVWVQICQTGDVQLGRQRAPQFHTGSNMVPYLRVANVFEDRIDISDVMEMHFSSDEEENFRLLAQDVLLNEGQSLELIGRPAIYRGELPRACFTNTLVRYRADVGVLPEFALALFLHYMHSGRFRKIATITTNIAHLGVGRFAQVEFPLPSTEEQAVIVDLLKEQMDNLERQKHAISVALKQSTAQRQNILRAAFSGQLVPQDPNDEPASVLLERIRAERAAQAAMRKSRVAANGGRKTRHEN